MKLEFRAVCYAACFGALLVFASAELARPQAPPIAPKPVFPKWNATGKDWGSTGNWVVVLRPVINATKYQICIRDYGTSSCYYKKTQNASSAYSSGSTLQFGVTIPSNKQSTIAEWTARACNDQNQCGPLAKGERFTVVPNAPKLSSPGNNTTQSSRSLRFSWQANSAANAGYQLIIVKHPGSDGYNFYNPTATLPGGNLNIQLRAGTTSKTVNVPATLGLTIRWSVVSCANFSGKGRRCSLGTRPNVVFFKG